MLNTKIRESKIPNTSDLVTTTVLNTKTNENTRWQWLSQDNILWCLNIKHWDKIFQYFWWEYISPESTWCKDKRKGISWKIWYLTNLVKNSNLNTKLATKAELKVLKDKIWKLQAFNIGKGHFKDDDTKTI